MMNVQAPYCRDLPVYLVCPHCKQETAEFFVECDGYGFPTQHCGRHGDVIAIRSHVRNQMSESIPAYIACAAGDPLVDDVCADFQARSRLGQRKYGATMIRDDLDLLDWLNHLKAELMDAVLYAEAAIRRVERMTDDGR